MSIVKRTGPALLLGLVGALCLPWLVLNIVFGGMSATFGIFETFSTESNENFGKFEVIGVPAGDSVEIPRSKIQRDHYKLPKQWFDRPGVFDYTTAKDGHVSFGPSYNSFGGNIALEKISFRIEDLKRHLPAGKDEYPVNYYGGESYSPFRLVDFDGDGEEEVIFQYFYDTIMGPGCLNISVYKVKDNVPVQIYRRYWAKSRYKITQRRGRPILYNRDSVGRGIGYTLVNGEFQSVLLPLRFLLLGWIEYVDFAYVVISFFPALFWWVYQRSTRGRNTDELLGFHGLDKPHLLKCLALWIFIFYVMTRLCSVHHVLFGFWNWNVFPLALLSWKFSAWTIARRRPRSLQDQIPDLPAIDQATVAASIPSKQFVMKGNGKVSVSAACLSGVWFMANLIYICSCFFPLDPMRYWSDTFDALEARKSSRRAFEVVGVPVDRPIRIFRHPNYGYGRLLNMNDTDISRWKFEVDTSLGKTLAGSPKSIMDEWDRPSIFNYNSITDSWIAFSLYASSGTVPLKSVSFEPTALQTWLDSGFTQPTGPNAQDQQNYFVGDFDGDGIAREVFLTYANSGIFWRSCWNETVYRVDPENRPTKIYSDVCRKYPHVLLTLGKNSYFATTENGIMGISKRIGSEGLEKTEIPLDVEIYYLAKYLELYWILCSLFPVLLLAAQYPCRFVGYTFSEKIKIAAGLGIAFLAAVILAKCSAINDKLFGLMNLNLGLVFLIFFVLFLKILRVDFIRAAAETISTMPESPDRQAVPRGAISQISIPSEGLRNKWRVMGPYILIRSVCTAWPYIVMIYSEGELNFFYAFGLSVLSAVAFVNIFFRLIIKHRSVCSFTEDGIIYNGPEQEIHVYWSGVKKLSKRNLGAPDIWRVACKNRSLSFDILKSHPQAPLLESLIIQKGIPIDENSQL